jgi:diguanylate cyclase (GGDEF)-like protein
MQSAEEDALTGVGNRRLLERFLDHPEVASSAVVIAIADVDHFKEINDSLGHEIGDRVLMTLGRLFTAEVRAHQVVVRFGGDEFVFALLDCELERARLLAERLRLKVASHSWGDLDDRLRVTISLGVARGRAEAWRSILVDADRSLYVAKRGGRNKVVCPAPETGSASRR